MKKITADIERALQKCVDGFGSIPRFAEKVGVNTELLAKYLGRKTNSIADETWEKIYPFMEQYLPKKEQEFNPKKAESLTSDERILLDAFAELPQKLRNQKLLEIVELAKAEIQKKKKD